MFYTLFFYGGSVHHPSFLYRQSCPNVIPPIPQNKRIWEFFRLINPIYKNQTFLALIQQQPSIEPFLFKLYGHNIILRPGRLKFAVKTINKDSSVTRPLFPKKFYWTIEFLNFPRLLEICNNPGDYIFVYGWPAWYLNDKILRRKYYDENELRNPPLIPKFNPPLTHKHYQSWIDHLYTYPESLFIVDVDGCPKPPEITIKNLPEPFSNSKCLIQYTASHGIKPGYRFRAIWFVQNSVNKIKNLEMLKSTAEYLKQYLPEIDTNIYTTCHPITLSAPIDKRPEKEKINPRAFILDGEYPLLDLGTIDLTITKKQIITPLSWQWQNPILKKKKEKPKKEPKNQWLQNKLKEAREIIGVEGHHRPIIKYAILLKKAGYDEDEILKELETVMATCNRMDKSESEWKKNYDNDNYRKNVIRWVCRNVSEYK